MQETDVVRTELSKVGIEVRDIYDLVNTGVEYPAAIPALIRLLDLKTLSPKTKEGIVRALTVKRAKGLANFTLLKLYESSQLNDTSLRWAIGNAFTVIIVREDIPKILEIIKNKNNGLSRQMFLLSLGVFKIEEVEVALIELLNDDEVVLHALSSLRKFKSIQAVNTVQTLMNHENNAVRKESKNYLAKARTW